MERFLRWCRKHAPKVAALAVGAMLGVMWKYPAGWNPPPEMQNVMGGVIGSVLTVAGALIVMKAQFTNEARKERRVKLQASQEKLRIQHGWRQALANALYTDAKGAVRLIERSIEVWSEDMGDGARRAWLTRLSLLPLPSFELHVQALPNLGYPLALITVHTLGEVMRMRAYATGQSLTNDNSADNTDFARVLKNAMLPKLHENLMRTMDLLWPHTHFDGDIQHHRQAVE